VFAIGKLIFDRNSKTHIGELILGYHVGGHHAAGTCQVGNDSAEQTLKELISQICADGKLAVTKSA
jgi:nanoRNase/pAp phosphatase (c-di-AMP/oligoRNAs hydrolase)